MKTLTQSIIECTGMHPEEYKNVVLDTYVMCMNKISKTTQHLQMLLVNRRINNWFLAQVEKVNQEFLNDLPPFLKLSKAAIKIYYIQSIKRITQNYPKVLIDEVKITNNINGISFN
ncbi:hypothetical protein PL373_06105 [Tenacibaculum maritimum]|nr:hypothetical protein [Tenacibaculum maritimum]MDB0600724.1 hypothetical protein [Tenacibaculum maritimum]MDB0612707.1 hypothetical protein [Tenacibaculum maritimum]